MKKIKFTGCYCEEECDYFHKGLSIYNTCEKYHKNIVNINVLKPHRISKCISEYGLNKE